MSKQDWGKVENLAQDLIDISTGDTLLQRDARMKKIGEAGQWLRYFIQQHDELSQENDDLQSSLDLQWKAAMRGIKMWQVAHPDKQATWPDAAVLMVWLMEQLDELP